MSVNESAVVAVDDNGGRKLDRSRLGGANVVEARTAADGRGGSGGGGSSVVLLVISGNPNIR